MKKNYLFMNLTDHRLQHSELTTTCEVISNISNASLLHQLKACRNKRDLENGKRLHTTAKDIGCHHNVYIANTLISMYSKCGDILQARSVFDTITQRTVVSWNIIIQGYVVNGQHHAALNMFSRMDCPPDRLTFVAALKACIGLGSREKGVSVHRKATTHGLDRDLVVSNTLIDMYCKLEETVRARAVFDSMPLRDVVSWTTLIVGYVENGQPFFALKVFGCMDCSPNSFTFSAAIKTCGELSSENGLRTGMEIHKRVRELGLDGNTFISNALIDMYSKYGEMRQAQEVFDRMRAPDVVTWNTLILGYAENGESRVALEVFRHMDCLPSPATFVAGLKACTALAARSKVACLENGVGIHRLAERHGCDRELSVSTTLTDMYGKAGCMSRARSIFDRMTTRTVVAWNVLILGYVENGLGSTAMDVFKTMDCPADRMTYIGVLRACAGLGEREPGLKVYKRVFELGLETDQLMATCLVDFFGKCANMNVAEAMFGCMPSPDTVSWTALIGGYSSLGDTSRVFALVEEMEECDAWLNNVTVQLVLTACSHAGLVDKGREFLTRMRDRGFQPTVEHYACMVDMLARANKLEEALDVVSGMRVRADSTIWTSLLGECAKRGNLKVGKVAFSALVALHEDEDSVASAYVLMRNVYERGADVFLLNEQNG